MLPACLCRTSALVVPVLMVLSSCGSVAAEYAPATPVLQILQGAEDRFVPPDPQWLEDTRSALEAEMRLVDQGLSSQGTDYAQGWKDHFRWDSLWRNVIGPQPANLEEVTLSRRWMFSNRKGTAHPFFTELRRLTDDYLDATYTFSRPDLRQHFQEKLQIARDQIAVLLEEPNDAHATQLGKTLGWFEQTRQLTDEVRQLRASLSQPNLQLFVDHDLIRKIMATQDTSAEKTLEVSDQGMSPKSRPRQRSRPVHVRGTAHTEGNISLHLVPNRDLAELSIAYQGIVESHCRAYTGPVSFTMQTLGSVIAHKPLTFDMDDIQLGETTVVPDVQTSVTGVYADRALTRRIGSNRINHPTSRASMSRRAEEKARNLIRTEMDQRVETSIEEIRSEIRRMQNSYSQFGDVFAPLVREGAAPRFVGTSSTKESVNLEIENRRRHQMAATNPIPPGLPQGELTLCLHASFINNMLGTVMGGKKFTDEYFMKYAKVLQATLPLPLMVHSRAPRWAIVADSERPFELVVPRENEFRMTLQIAALELDGERYELPSTATIVYAVAENEFGEVYLERNGELELNSELATYQSDFLHTKLSAFFAEVLDGSGVIIPEGGSLGALKSLQSKGFAAREDWLSIAWDVPQELVDEMLRPRTQDEPAPANPISEFPPAFALDADLATYPSGLD